jgi:hypothetical protein
MKWMLHTTAASLLNQKRLFLQLYKVKLALLVTLFLYHTYFVVCTAKLAMVAAPHSTSQVNNSSSSFSHIAARLCYYLKCARYHYTDYISMHLNSSGCATAAHSDMFHYTLFCLMHTCIRCAQQVILCQRLKKNR